MSSVSHEIPPVTKALIDHLEKKWPLEYFMTTSDLQGMHRHQGRVEVVQYLRLLLQQIENY